MIGMRKGISTITAKYNGNTYSVTIKVINTEKHYKKVRTQIYKELGIWFTRTWVNY